jgi:hypothetical protein
LNILKGFWKNIQISNFVKILPEESGFFHVNGQTDITELAVALSDFAKAPNTT